MLMTSKDERLSKLADKNTRYFKTYFISLYLTSYYVLIQGVDGVLTAFHNFYILPTAGVVPCGLSQVVTDIRGINKSHRQHSINEQNNSGENLFNNKYKFNYKKVN